MGNISFGAAFAAGGSVAVLVILMSMAHMHIGLAVLLGGLLGAITAYMSYKPREIWAASREAWRERREGLRQAAGGVTEIGRKFGANTVRNLVEFGHWATKHPLNILALVGPAACIGVRAWLAGTFSFPDLGMMFVLSVGLPVIMAFTSAKTCEILCDWMPEMVQRVLGVRFVSEGVDSREEIARFMVGVYWGEKEYTLKRWIALMVLAAMWWVIMLLLILVMLVLLALAVVCGVIWIIQFGLTVNRKIHSELRTMALVDGPVGGLLGFLVAFNMRGMELIHAPIVTKLSVVALGSVCALALGYFNYLIVARRVLAIEPQA